MNSATIRNIKVNDNVLINGIKHLCTSATGYANQPNINFRFTNMLLPKTDRHSVYNEFYYPCETLKQDIDTGKILFSKTDEKKLSFQQLTLF